MVKVGSMSRAKRILLIAGMLLIGASSAEARLWGRKADKPAKADAMPAGIALRTVEVEGSRVVLRTSGAPAYTSYSPSPGVFVVDLTGTSRDSSMSIPATLPPAVSSISADDVTEMGSSLTRVTFRLTESLLPEVSATDNAVVITVPATAIAIQEAPAVDVLPPVIPAQTASVDPAPASIEPLAEPAEEVSEPVARIEPVVESTPEPAPMIASSTPSEAKPAHAGQLNRSATPRAIAVRMNMPPNHSSTAAPPNPFAAAAALLISWRSSARASAISSLNSSRTSSTTPFTSVAIEASDSYAMSFSTLVLAGQNAKGDH